MRQLVRYFLHSPDDLRARASCFRLSCNRFRLSCNRISSICRASSSSILFSISRRIPLVVAKETFATLLDASSPAPGSFPSASISARVAATSLSLTRREAKNGGDARSEVDHRHAGKESRWGGVGDRRTLFQDVGVSTTAGVTQ